MRLNLRASLQNILAKGGEEKLAKNQMMRGGEGEEDEIYDGSEEE